MSILGRLVRSLAPRHPGAEPVDTAGQTSEIEHREVEVEASVAAARIAHREAHVQMDRMGRLLAQARLEAKALGAPPMVDKPLRRPRPRPVGRRNQCAASS